MYMVSSFAPEPEEVVVVLEEVGVVEFVELLEAALLVTVCWLGFVPEDVFEYSLLTFVYFVELFNNSPAPISE